MGFLRGRSGVVVSRSSKASDVRSDDEVFGLVEVREPSVGRFTADGSGDVSEKCETGLAIHLLFNFRR